MDPTAPAPRINGRWLRSVARFRPESCGSPSALVRNRSGTTLDHRAWNRCPERVRVVVAGTRAGELGQRAACSRDRRARRSTTCRQGMSTPVRCHLLRERRSASGKARPTTSTSTTDVHPVHSIAWTYRDPLPGLRVDSRLRRVLRLQGGRGVDRRRAGDAAARPLLRRLGDQADQGADQGRAAAPRVGDANAIPSLDQDRGGSSPSPLSVRAELIERSIAERASRPRRRSCPRAACRSGRSARSRPAGGAGSGRAARHGPGWDPRRPRTAP